MPKGSLICGAARDAAGAAAVTLVFGLSGLGLARDLRAEPSAVARERLPAWFAEALARIAEGPSFGVAILVPEGRPAQDLLARQLHALLSSADPGTREALAEAVYVCVRPEWVEAKAGETAVLIDEKGRRLGGAAVSFADGKAFADGMCGLLRGEGRFETRLKRERTPEIAKALSDLGAEGFDARERAAALLAGRLPSCAAAVIDARAKTEELEVRARCEEVVAEGLRRRAEKGARGWLPFGVEWGAWEDENANVRCKRVAVPCGIRAPGSRETQAFLKFLAR